MADPAAGVSSASPLVPAALAASLVLVRHGESVWVAEGRFQGRRDPPLSELGRRQAELVARRLADPAAGAALPIPAGTPVGVWHSPLSRAAETARLIAAALPGTAARPCDDLTEIAQGEWEGLLHSEVSARWVSELAAWRRSPTTDHAPGGEPLLAAAERVRRALAELSGALAPERAPARRAPGPPPPPGRMPGYPAPPDDATPARWAVLVAHDGIFRLVLMTLLGVPYERFWSFPFNLCAISVVSLSEGVAVLRAHNLSDHLAPLAAAERAAEEARGDRRGAL